MSGASAVYRCRGVRKWCDRRCEASTAVEPPGFPVFGFYCALHGYQKPRQTPDGGLAFTEAVCEEHVRRRTSFVAPEAAVAAEMAKSPGLVRDRPNAKAAAAGQAVLEWLTSRRGLPEEAARAYAQRMLTLELLQPLTASGGAPVFSTGKDAFYRIAVPAVAAKK
jgi:hypothetical protein